MESKTCCYVVCAQLSYRAWLSSPARVSSMRLHTILTPHTCPATAGRRVLLLTWAYRSVSRTQTIHMGTVKFFSHGPCEALEECV